MYKVQVRTSRGWVDMSAWADAADARRDMNCLIDERGYESVVVYEQGGALVATCRFDPVLDNTRTTYRIIKA